MTNKHNHAETDTKTTIPSDDRAGRTPSNGRRRTAAQARRGFDVLATGQVGGPTFVAWCEGTLTRVKELESLSAWVEANPSSLQAEPLIHAIHAHLEAARQATEEARSRIGLPVHRKGPLTERAMSNLDAAEAQLLNVAPPRYVLGQMPSLLRHVQCHLIPSDPRRKEFERIAQRLGVGDPAQATALSSAEQDATRRRQVHDDMNHALEEERGRIVTAVRGASSAALREQIRLRSFRNILIITTLLMTMLAIAVAVLGFRSPTVIPLCFAPEESGQAVVVCPTAQSRPFSTARTQGTTEADIDDAVMQTARRQDLFVVEFVGLTAAAVAAASAIRRIRGSSERYGLPTALALLKLPTGAITAFLGLLLMRGQFVPGLSALDTSAQILAWALIFGYAQQLFTRLVDQQGQSVLENVRGANRPESNAAPP